MSVRAPSIQGAGEGVPCAVPAVTRKVNPDVSFKFFHFFSLSLIISEYCVSTVSSLTIHNLCKTLNAPDCQAESILSISMRFEVFLENFVV